MANLFAYRETLPSKMKQALNPVGEENDKHLVELAGKAGLIIGAWGNDGVFKNRSSVVKELIPDLHYLKLSESPRAKARGITLRYAQISSCACPESSFP